VSVVGRIVRRIATGIGRGGGTPGRGRSIGLFDYWINGGRLWCTAVACLGRALRLSRSRVAWLLVALALASWATADTIWSMRFGEAAAPPPTSTPTSISDVFWLAWYPLIVAAIVCQSLSSSSPSSHRSLARTVELPQLAGFNPITTARFCLIFDSSGAIDHQSISGDYRGPCEPALIFQPPSDRTIPI
jgi:hypothetical protein